MFGGKSAVLGDPEDVLAAGLLGNDGGDVVADRRHVVLHGELDLQRQRALERALRTFVGHGVKLA
ncbi:hypothetical protein D3C72_2467460 [compost metagenome]